ncbi:MAG: Type 1 glutamine amidotransferase-like domain-containing protein [Marmoricola sp.]
MSVHLVGGGWSDAAAPVIFSGFLTEAAERALSRRTTPRVGLVLMGTDPESTEYHEKYVRALGQTGLPHELAVIRIEEGTPCPPLPLGELDGLFVGGGPTPEYHASMVGLYAAILAAVLDGLPYLGFSAGAEIAPRRAIVGGWRIGGIAVTPEDNGEDLDEVTVVDGIGLVDFAIEVHTAQWGTLGRVVGAVEAGLVDSAMAIDECTVLVAGDGLHVAGEGVVRRIQASPHGVLVSRLT